MRYHYMQTNVAKIKRTHTIKSWQGYGAMTLPYSVWGEQMVEIGRILENGLVASTKGGHIYAHCMAGQTPFLGL